jgi:cell division protein FtsW (lipid II flippase)
MLESIFQQEIYPLSTCILIWLVFFLSSLEHARGEFLSIFKQEIYPLSTCILIWLVFFLSSLEHARGEFLSILQQEINPLSTCKLLLLIFLSSLEHARGEFLSIFQVLDDFGTSIDRGGGLFFNPDDFRANKQVRQICQ